MRLALLLALVPAALSSATLTLPAVQPVKVFVQNHVWVGKASYYHKKFTGLPMKNGELYDPAKATGASNIIPQGTIARVCRVDRPSHCDTVRITDTGTLKGRLVDLSRASAKKLGMLRQGVVKVTVTPLQGTFSL